MGGGLPQIAVCQSVHLLMIHRHRGKAPSHILIEFTGQLLSRLLPLPAWDP